METSHRHLHFRPVQRSKSSCQDITSHLAEVRKQVGRKFFGAREMAFGWTSSKAMILASFFLTCYVSVSIEAYIAAKPSGLNVQNIRGTVSSKTSMRMAIDMSAPTEEPMSVVVQPVAAPSQIVKQFSSSRVSSINLLKNCLGAGVFSLNARVSAISGSPMTIIPAAALVITMAMWATYNFYMVGETCRMTDSVSYAGAWSKTVSPESQWLVQSVVVVSPIVSCLASTIVLTDILGLVLLKIGMPASIYGNRNLVIGILSTCVLYPLCILKDLSALKSVSVLGVAGHLVAMGALALRIYDKSYFPGGKFFSTVAAASSTATTAVASVGTAGLSKWFVLASLLSYCFVTHYNAPRYYSELEPKETDRGHFLKMAFTSYSSAALIYIGTMALGLVLFGAKSASFALNSFSQKDPFGSLARFAFGTSVLASFPLIFLSMRNWFVAQAVSKVPAIGGIKRISSLLLVLISFLASRFTDIGVVGSVAGGVLGSSMMFVFPPIMYIRALQKQAKKDNVKPPQLVIAINSILMVLGATLGIVGTTASLMASKR